MRIHVNGIDRDATTDEQAIIEATQADMQAESSAQAAAAVAEKAAKASAKAKLAALGLTEVEVSALIGA
jgi:hypothetical protein